MARKGALVVACAFALRALQCASDPSADDPSVRLPPRADGGEANEGPDGGDAATVFGVETGTSEPACDPSKPFGTPTRIADFDAGAPQSTPRLAADELTIYFTTSSAGAGSELAKAVRASRTAPFGPAGILAQSSPSNDNDPAVSADHLHLFFHSARGGNADLYVASRARTSDAFGSPTPIDAVNTAGAEAHAYFREAAHELWFVRQDPTTKYDIWVAKQTGAGPMDLAPPTKVEELSSPSEDWQPQITEDGLAIVFASDRPGGKGKFDLWMATRASANKPFDPPKPITELNSDQTEFAGWLSADTCRIWFSSGRNTADANGQLFYAEKPR